jgi:hypothetical protein
MFFEMIESSHTLLLSFRGNLLWVLMNPEPTVEFAFPGSEFLRTGIRAGSRERQPKTDTPMVDHPVDY